MTARDKMGEGRKYPCKESPDGLCEHGGNKAFNHGFVCGTAAFCRHESQKRFLSSPGFVCPKNAEAMKRKIAKLGRRPALLFGCDYNRG